ncbi:MAG: PqqD family protein [Clostridia bacterium]|nr:PqqD family protein [Clostridia bacterium]
MKIKGKYIVRKVAGETIVVPACGAVDDSNILIMLNETGVELWNLLYEGCSEDEVVEHFCHEYDVEKETVLKDLGEFIDYITSEGVVIE